MKQYKRHRYISVFDKTKDLLVFELEFDVLPSIETLIKIFQVEDFNPMYDEFPINESFIDSIKPYLKTPFNFDKYDYFLSCNRSECHIHNE